VIPGISTDSGEGLQSIPANSLLGNNTGSTANPIALTPAEVSTLLSLSTTYLALTGGMITGNLNLGGQLLIERDVPTHVAIAASVLNASNNGTIQYRFQRTNADFLGSLVAAWRGGTTNNRINIETYGNGDSVDPLTAIRGSLNGSALALRSTYALGWTSTVNASTGTIDVQLVRDAANTLALRNALNPQALLIENTWTSATNRETGFARWVSNSFCVGTEKGTLGGTAQRMELQTDGVTRLRIDTNYEIRVGDQGSNAPSLFTFAASAVTSNGPGRGLTIYGRNNVTGGTNLSLSGEPFSTTSGASVHLLVGCNFAPAGGTGTFTVNRVAPTINQTAGANGITRGISVEPTLTSAADWRSFDTMVNTGFAYHSSGTAPSRFGGVVQVVGDNIRFVSAVAASIGTTLAQTLAFTTNSSTRGSIDSVGRWIIGNFTDTSSSGVTSSVTINPTYNQTGTAGSTDLRFNRTETALGSGAHNFIDCQVGGASRFRVSNTGEVIAVGNLTAPIGTTADLMIGTGPSGIMETKTPVQARSAIGVNTGTLQLDMNGDGAVLPVSVLNGRLRVPYNCTINSWEMVSEESGSLVVAVLKDSLTNWPPNSADAITGTTNRPTITASQRNDSSTLTGWAPSLNEGDYIKIEVISVASVINATLVLRVTRT